MITRLLIIFLLVSSLGGCDPSDLSPNTLKPICDALIGPIRYNTYTKTSTRYAGPVLGLDLKRRNQVGQRLGCPLYKPRW
jgi:hypothetical protein